MRHIFIFGSNTEGIHSGGAARHAHDNYHAEYGNPKGLQGDSYAIITKDLNIGERSIGLDAIEEQVIEFNTFTKQHPEMKFLVTGIGMGLAGFSVYEIAPMFKKLKWGMNVFFSHEFVLSPKEKKEELN